jgi:hypothetical protein
MEPEPFIVAVQWTDSHRPSKIWVHKDHLDHNEAICLSVGIVSRWDKVGMTLAMASQEDSYGSTFFIPAGAIKDVRVLEYNKKCRSVLASKSRGQAGTKAA